MYPEFIYVKYHLSPRVCKFFVNMRDEWEIPGTIFAGDEGRYFRKLSVVMNVHPLSW